MRNPRTSNMPVFGLLATCLGLASIAGCGALAVLPFTGITAVQLFDQPNYTVAFSVEGAVTNPALIAKINWVFGDGGGFVEGPAGRATITHRYDTIGTYNVSAYLFDASGFVAQIDGVARVVENTGPTPGPSPTDLPGQIEGPNPTDGAASVNVKTTFTWTGAENATSHDVYLGTVEADVEAADTASPLFRGNTTDTSFDPKTLAEFDPNGLLPETEYFWRIDGRNDLGVTAGEVLSFTTGKAPKEAKNFVPADGAGSVPVNQILQWTAGANATSHDIYFGKTFAEVDGATTETDEIFQGNQTAGTFDPEDDLAEISGELLASTAYYWRIDEVGLGGTTKGDVLSFTTAALPPAIYNISPADGALDVDVNANLSWSASPSVTSFDVYFGVDQVAVQSATRSSPEFEGNQTAKSFDPGEMLGDLTFYWRVDTLGPGGTADGTVYSFTTAMAPAQVAGPFTPLNNASNVSIDIILGWNVGGGGGPTDSFDVYFGTDEAAVTSGAGSVFQGNQDVANTQFDPQGADDDTEYFWRVDAVGPGGTTPGPVLRFRTGALPNVAENPVPADDATGVALDVVLSWTAGLGATSHDVYFGTSENAVNNATDASAEFQGEQAGTTFDPLGPVLLEGDTTYYWRIDEESPGGTTKGPVWSFTTAPGKAKNPNPLHQDTGISLSAALSWTTGGGAVSHNVYFGTVEADVLNATTASAGIFQGNQAGTTFDPPGLLVGATTYYWRIDEVGAPTDGTTKGDVWSFTTAAGQAAEPISPANGAVGVALQPTLSWTAGTGAGSHDVYLGTSASAVEDATTFSAEFQTNLPAATTNFSPAPLNGNTQYYWRIDERDADDNVTKGEVWQFRTRAGKATNPTPSQFATGVALDALLSWSAGSGAATHDVYLSTTLADVQNGAPAAFQGNQIGTTYNPGGLIANTTYYWRIDEVLADGTTKTAGDVWSFTTLEPPAQVGGPNPFNGATAVAVTSTLNWNAAARAASYDVYLSMTEADVVAGAPAAFQGNQTGTSFNPTPDLAASTTYYWRIDAVNDAGTTNGVVWSFTTAP